MKSVDTTAAKAKTGVAGLDDILSGGFSRGHMFLVEGAPGTGKTTVALQFLLAGVEAGEKCLYITLSETERELRDGAASHGWSLGDGLKVFELLPQESLLDSDQQQSLLYSSDLELGETTKQIFEAVERARPHRVVLDSLSEIRLLAQSSLRYRRQILAIKHYFAKFNTTVMLLDDLTADVADKTVHSAAHGVLRLEELAPAYGAERRRVRVVKYRGVKFRGGYHDATITTGGLKVFPRLVASEYRNNFTRSKMSSGIAEFDQLLGGGIDGGSSALILGPAGTGKSRVAFVFAGAATFMTVAQHGLVGDMEAPVDVTYLADTVILLRYFEALGRVRRAMSIIKKRTGMHESTIREYRIDDRGLTIDQPLDGFLGILRGVPSYIGEGQPLLQEPSA